MAEKAIETATQRMIKVMQEVRELNKNQRNREQGFKFRGIDDLMNILGPVLRTHELIISLVVNEVTRDEYTTKSGSHMNRTIVEVSYEFTAPDGSMWRTDGVGEGADVGDKSTSKALSMAMKYALLQALCLPTDDTDPDAINPADDSVPEAHSAKVTESALEDKVAEAKQALLDWASQNDVSTKQLAKEFLEDHKVTIPEATLEQLNTFYTKKTTGAEIIEEDPHGGKP